MLASRQRSESNLQVTKSSSRRPLWHPRQSRIRIPPGVRLAGRTNVLTFVRTRVEQLQQRDNDAANLQRSAMVRDLAADDVLCRYRHWLPGLVGRHDAP